jgi:tetratricopeptide (TPR) repeat protein
MNASPETVSPQPASTETKSVPRRPRRAWRRWCVIIALLPVAGWGGYRGWLWFETMQFRRRCEAARQAEDWHTLSLAGKAWGEWDPAAGRAWWFAAQAAQELDDLEDLAACLGRVPDTDPKVLFAYVEKANLEWTALNRPLQALETSRRAVALDPRLVEIQSRLISFYAMNLQRPQMLQAIRTAMDAGAEPKESYTYLILADLLSFSNGMKLNSTWLASAPDEMRFKVGLAVHTSMAFAQNVETSGTAEAVDMDRQATQQINWFLDQHPHDPILLTYLMYRAYQAGDVERMGQLLAGVDESGVDDHMVWVYRGWYHAAFDDFDEAERAVREGLRLHPLSPLAHHEYASLLRKAKRPQSQVEEQQHLAAGGRELRTQMLRLSSALDATPMMLQQIAQYAEECGDTQVVGALSRRLQPDAPMLPSRPPVR